MNPYDLCVANTSVQDGQHTVTWHVDDQKSSHKDAKVNDEFTKWLEKTYGGVEAAPVKVKRGKIHEYLAMRLNYSEPGTVIIDMTEYVKGMISDFPNKLVVSRYPWNEQLFKIDTESKELPKAERELFHTFVAKGLFLCMRGRPDIQPAIALLATRVRNPTDQDNEKLERLLGYLMATEEDVIRLKINPEAGIKWYVDASFAVHNDMRSHTAAVMTLGEGAIYATCTKQKINTRSSTEAELVSMDNVLAKVLWIKRLITEQQWEIKQVVIYRVNVS